VKDRKALLDKMVIKIIEEKDYGMQERYAIEMEALGMDKKHINLLSSTYPKISSGEIVRIFKSISAREIFRRHPEIKKELWSGELCLMDTMLQLVVGEEIGQKWKVIYKNRINQRNI